jgi:hypothetical protein
VTLPRQHIVSSESPLLTSLLGICVILHPTGVDRACVALDRTTSSRVSVRTFFVASHMLKLCPTTPDIGIILMLGYVIPIISCT